MDGPAGLNQAPVEPGDSFTYEFVATPGGTRWYHSHTDVAMQVMLGLYGSLIVEPRHQPVKYDRDYTYILSEWDMELTPEVATGAAPRGPRDSQLRGGELGTDLFMIDGKIHDAIPPIVVTEGDNVLIRLINAGTVPHPFHTHGHSFKVVATDGNPVPEAAQIMKDTILVAPGERYDIAFIANNPGVWMIHCHIENHAANGMMSVIQYEGEVPTGPIGEFWNLTPEAGSDGQQVPSHGGSGEGGHGMEGHGHPGSESTPEAGTPAASVPAESPTASDTVMINMFDDRFEPKSLTIKAGQTVVWVNNGADWHSVAAFDASFESDQIAPGETFSHTFTTPGIYKFICKHHARHGMIGEIVVTE
jgi:plastocyanin